VNRKCSPSEWLDDDHTRSVLLGSALSVIAPIKSDSGSIIGAALVRIPTDRMWQAVQNQLKIATIIALAVLGAGFLLSLLLAKRQVAPIEALTAAATSVEERKFDPTSLDAVTERRDEIGRLARVQQVEIASNRKKLTVFFSDIVGFTETTENLDSEELTSILNRYLNEMASLALKYGATLDKYVGDAIIAFFGDPETKGVAEDAKACVAMAVEMQQRSAELESQWQDAGLERPFRVRMGMNTGFCRVGNFGSQDRMDYTIIGGAVNLAARLESAAEPGKILIAHETWSLVKDAVNAKEMSPLMLKGFGQPLHVYELLGLRESVPTKQFAATLTV